MGRLVEKLHTAMNWAESVQKKEPVQMSQIHSPKAVQCGLSIVEKSTLMAALRLHSQAGTTASVGLGTLPA